MLNQMSVEAVYSATYVENYLDCVENLPNELQRLISRMRELDVCYLARVKDATQQRESWKKLGNPVKKARCFARMQQALIAAQELGDEKMVVVQTILDKIELKGRLLNQDFKNLDISRDEIVQFESKEQQPPTVNSNTNTNSQSNERANKRARRTKQEGFSGLDSNQCENTNGEQSQPYRIQNSTANNSTAATTNASQKKTTTGKKKKRKARQTIQSSKDDSPMPDDEPSIDPDEPTYCLCDQISYGEMIMCDNDLCPIEWFHFSCVTLTTKPKGKWYCPKCRGDRPNVMKPKAQFLRELEKYNKDKEEKT